ncbi:MFS transporter [Dehalobacterium formicoaceticum]|uniref:MFS transporter n=1 Tax=Dehalobacterium formicoaceticum TaxID=51515 RepID=A0ABT1Y0N7_9FIRM|nr:MFS transporter [Dehalobacterium formicoaceticum]MCR6544432.1 MFS transporter [Dehalobacterium formicoaceticum]
MGKKRNIVLAILFLTWTISYMDRMVMTVAIPYISKEFNLTSVQMGVVMSAFFMGYTFFQLPGGMLSDKFGARKVMTFAIAWWSAFTAFTGMITSYTSLLVVRVLFGLGEASFPSGSWKTISTWFPKKERATANSMMMAASAIGTAIAPLFVVGIMSYFGWRSVFLFLFIPGIIIAALIWVFVRDNPAQSKMITPEELSVIQEDNSINEQDAANKEAVNKLSFKDIIKLPVMWKLFFLWLTFDIVFWGFGSWIPSYLVNERHFVMVKMGIIASLPYFAGTIGTWVSGYISDKFFVGKRRNFIIICEVAAALFLFLTYNAPSEVLAITFLTVAGFFVCATMGAFWAIPMDILPAEVMGSGSGFINTGGQIAGIISPIIMGFLIQASGGSYKTAFTFLAISSLVSAGFALSINEKGKESSPKSITT